MLSILIPTYNYSITDLVEEIHAQITKINIPFEIRCYDDGSTDTAIITSNKNINNLERTSYYILNKNIGRSAVRNLLAKDAKFDWLLFLDADVLPKSSDFISKYLKTISETSQVIYGGILYSEEKPSQSHLLRWVYGSEREALSLLKRKEHNYISFLTLNFLINKNVFSLVSFNEDIPNLRHEDTLFSYNLRLKNVQIEHIENPTYHIGLEESSLFYKKSIESVDALYYFLNCGIIPRNYTKITRVFFNLKKYGFHYILAFIYILFKHYFKRNLLSGNPSLFIFDLCRLSYLCHLYTK
ncbi:glycosyltransferase family 2 protein [Bizionia argentinensis JUB59]|uniref:Glycosyltransferase family 2 protein n=1 Tax=Bizionia argentinensis JUB59 TaxID=1046627 RepID=G2EG71_9FLAO|nr:glycosyltransferase family 2 protein [Bizionia argentinensis]EGV42624.1 glycosyltransferase family 2 protein [Bizionia argentinensis JUB59]